ncbi:hypothetical protein C8Q73DRAFT_209597 [Cubamyces lactineus]|nr:hypothetical protein C8Q73DRAFT_209597 [Cubamyces lactineus]
MAVQPIQTGPGQSFSIPFAPSSVPSPPAASPSSTSSTVIDSPRTVYVQSPHYRRVSQGPLSAYGTPVVPMYELESDDSRSALVESLSRSVTVVFWYKANTQPLRLHQEIPTFPLFAFSSLTDIVDGLSLSDNSYLDAYDPRSGAWEQQKISAVRRIESEQRLLYRIRRNLFEGMEDDECPGLENEIKLQDEDKSGKAIPIIPLSTSLRIKRPADQSLSPPVSKHQRSISIQPTSFAVSFAGSPSSIRGQSVLFSSQGGSPTVATSPALPAVAVPSGSARSFSSRQPTQPPEEAQPPSTVGALPPPQPVLSESVTTTQETQSAVIPVYQVPPASSTSMQPTAAVTTPTAAASTSTHPAPASLPVQIAIPPPPPPLYLSVGALPRRWPNDFFVYEIAAGLRAMERLAAAEPGLKQDEVFRRAFGGPPYVKSTFCRHRALWRQAGARVQAEFELMGRDARACWGEFVRRVEGREEGAGAGAGSAGSRRGRGRGRTKGGVPGGAQGAEGEAGEREDAQERMMGIIGMPLPMIMAGLPPQAEGVPLGSAHAHSSSASTGGQGHGQQAQRRNGPAHEEEPVMGSLMPPEEERDVQQRRMRA